MKTPEILDYQVRQTARGVDVAAVAVDSVDLAHVRTELAQALSGAGLRSPEVGLRIVDALERQAATGKCRRFVPLTSG